ncbi:unnamed protein product, partial [Prorocentrum cordatum]
VPVAGQLLRRAPGAVQPGQPPHQRHHQRRAEPRPVPDEPPGQRRAAARGAVPAGAGVVPVDRRHAHQQQDALAARRARAGAAGRAGPAAGEGVACLGGGARPPHGAPAVGRHRQAGARRGEQRQRDVFHE